MFSKQLLKKIRYNLSHLMFVVIASSSVMTTTMVATTMPVYADISVNQTDGAIGINEHKVIRSKKPSGLADIDFDYGTSFVSAAELSKELLAGISDTEDSFITIDTALARGLKVTNIAKGNKSLYVYDYKKGSAEEGLDFFNANNILSAGTYTAIFAYTDMGGKTNDNIKVTFQINNPSDLSKILNIKESPRYYLQGTVITDEILASQIEFLDTVIYKPLTYTKDKVTQGTYTVKDWGGLDTNKILNDGKGYDFEYYMTHKAEEDAKNTYTITYEYQSNGMSTSATATSTVTVVPVFPTFASDTNTFQIKEGYEAVYNDKGEITSFTNKLSLGYIKEKLNISAYSILKGDLVTNPENREDCTNNMYIHSVTYADGNTVTGENFIKTSDGLLGDEVIGTANSDGTFTLADGSIYPYRGNVSFVLGASNSYKNKRLSDYDSDFSHDITVHNPEEDDEDGEPLPDLDDEGFGTDIKPQSVPTINANDRWFIKGETIEPDNILDYIEATDTDENGKEIDLRGEVIIESIYKYDDYGNPKGNIYINDGSDGSDPFADGKFEEGVGTLSTDEICDYVIKFVVKNSNNKVVSYDIKLHVVDDVIREPYMRYSKLEYFIRIPENLDKDGYNVYYEKNSIWQNNKNKYVFSLYILCLVELDNANVLSDDYYIAEWHFTPEQRAVTQSWAMESGNAIAGQIVPEGTLVQGWLFKDDGGHYIKYRDDNHKMQKVYVDSNTIDYGMFPSAERNQKFGDTWYDTCCTVDMQLVAHQGGGDYCIIYDEDGNYLYYDKDTGKRMVYRDTTGDKKLTKEDMAAALARGDIWEDTRDYSDESVFEYGLKNLIKKYQKDIDKYDSLELINRALDTVKDFDVYIDTEGPRKESILEQMYNVKVGK